MGFDKDYPNRKDRRKKFLGAKNSKNFDFSCRCNGGCDYCRDNRQHSTNKRKRKADIDLKELKKHGYKEE